VEGALDEMLNESCPGIDCHAHVPGHDDGAPGPGQVPGSARKMDKGVWFFPGEQYASPLRQESLLPRLELYHFVIGFNLVFPEIVENAVDKALMCFLVSLLCFYSA